MTGATGKSFMCKTFMCLFCSIRRLDLADASFRGLRKGGGVRAGGRGRGWFVLKMEGGGFLVRGREGGGGAQRLGQGVCEGVIFVFFFWGRNSHQVDVCQERGCL